MSFPQMDVAEDRGKRPPFQTIFIKVNIIHIMGHIKKAQNGNWGRVAAASSICRSS
jgi:hypothetical protein